jgi:hypothetical protein
LQGTSLDLRNKQLTSINQKVFGLKQITVLDLSDNPGLVDIPQEIDSLKALKTLRLNGNGIN